MRAINNHEQIQHIVEKVGEYIAETISDENIDNIPVAKELLLQVDGGHMNAPWAKTHGIIVEL